MRPDLLVVVLAGVAAAAVTSAVAPTARPAGVEHRAGPAATGTAALAAARALADGDPAAAPVGGAVADALGYRPVPELGLLAHPEGDCSSPIPLPHRFEPACRVHDLGYDLLRVAHQRGVEIPGGLRVDLDSLLARQMRQTCGSAVPCRVVADIAHAAVHVNTVRQGHGAPVEERLPW